MAVFTVLLWLVSRDQKDIARETVTTTEAIERAYVTISHTPKTVEYNAGRIDTEPGAVWFEVEIKNFGNTPAEIIGGVMTVEIGQDEATAPATIPTRAYQPIAPAFLVPNASLFMRTLAFGFDHDEVRRAIKQLMMEDGTPLTMWLAGFVCYRDRFGGEHCGGYGRRWDRSHGDLVFDESTKHLNFDHPMTERERALCERKRQG